MLGHYFWRYWQRLWQASKCLMLRLEIWLLLYGDSDEVVPGQVERIIAQTKQRYPNRSLVWYLEKIINDLRD